MQPASIRVCVKRHENDCAVACFVMLLGVSYEAALIAISKVDPTLATKGLYFTQLRKAAKELGVKLVSVPRKKYDVDNAVGILGVKYADKHEHAVVLFRGVVIDPEGGIIWDSVDAFVEAEGVSLLSLLVLAEK